MASPSFEKRMLTVFPPVAFTIAVTAWAFRKKTAYYEHSEKLKIYIFERSSNTKSFFNRI